MTSLLMTSQFRTSVIYMIYLLHLASGLGGDDVVHIGLPEDHVDTDDCFDRACISDHDWHQIGDKWRDFKDIVTVMDNSTLKEARAAIWSTFLSGNLWKDDVTARDSDLWKIRNMKTFIDTETAEVRKIQLKDLTTRYDHQAIIMMEGDVTVAKAAHFLYNKHPEVSTLYEYNPESGTLTVVAGREHFIRENSRVQIVGHGRVFEGAMTLSTKSPQKVAEIVRKLPIKGSEIGRVGLVGCNIAQPGESEFLNDGFTENLLKSLYKEQGIRTEISARTGLVSITASGKKETGEIYPDGIHWFSKDPLSKTVIKFGDFGEIVRVKLPLTERIATFNEESSGALVKIHDINENSPYDNIKPIYIEKASSSGVVESMKKLNPNDIGEYISTITKETFLDENTYVQEKIIKGMDNPNKIKLAIEKMGTEIPAEAKISSDGIKKYTVKQNDRILYTGFEGDVGFTDGKHSTPIYKFKIEFHENGNLQMILNEGSLTGRKERFYLDSGISGEWKYVARLHHGTKQRVFKVELVRTITNRADLINEISMLGTFGIDGRNAEELYRYYRFGDVVYRMARSNFYIYWDGMIASESKIITSHLNNDRLTENDILNVKKWKWVDGYGRYDFPPNYNYEVYRDMKRIVQNKYLEIPVNEQITYWRSLGVRNIYADDTLTIVSDEMASVTLKGDKGWVRKVNLAYDSGSVLHMMESFINGDHVRISDRMVHVLEGSISLAVGLSEPIRNFRIHVINEMCISLNVQETITLGSFLKVHPMTRGQSWGYVGETGLTRTLTGYRPVQATKVLLRELNIARTFLLSKLGEDGVSKYRFITESEYLQEEQTRPPGELSKITKSVALTEIRTTVADFRPSSGDQIIRTRPLGGTVIEGMNALQAETNILSSKSSPLRASVAIAYDYIRIANHISSVVVQKNAETGRNYEIIESSITVDKDGIKFAIRDKANPLLEDIEISLRVDEETVTSKAVKEEALENLRAVDGTKGNPSKALVNLNTVLGVYGIVMGFRGAVQDFEEGKIFEGIVNIAQSVHGIYSMSPAAQKAVQTITSKVFSTGLQETGLIASSERSLAVAAEGFTAEESLAVAGKAAGDIPVLGTIFGVYNTVQDLRRGTTLGYIDAGLDAAITISALFGPEALVVTVALTIVRLVIDDFYFAISKELNNLPADATALQKIRAVIKGLGEGVVMVIKNIADFISLGFISFVENSKMIDEQYSKDHAQLQKMSNFHSYFKIEKEEGSSNKLIDFASGEESWNGGSIVFQLKDDNTASLQMRIVDENGIEMFLNKIIQLETGADDIVLGIGESHDISFKKHTSKIFWFIPVHSRYLIDKVRGEQDTLHGTYYGNSRNNKFFAIQNLPNDTSLGYELNDYFYELYGEGGDDIFYLGPQKSRIMGGGGHDTYIIPEKGGKTVIDNFAEDLKEDILFIQTDFERITVDRVVNDLVLQHGDGHDVVVKNWFSGHRMGHLTFKANKGVIFNVTIGIYGQASVVPLAIIRSGEDSDHSIDISKGIWRSVVMVIGSEGTDTITANDNNNFIDAGPGTNKIYGGPGSDTYVVKSVDKSKISEWNEINNYDEKLTVDKIILDVPYTMIKAEKSNTEIKIFSHILNNGPKLLLHKWFLSEYYRHLLLVTSDDIICKLTDDERDENTLQPIIFDATGEASRVVFNAALERFTSITTIIGSKFDDVLTGNDENNYIKGGEGKDYVTGGEGRDVYVVQFEDIGDVINNYAIDKKNDLLLLDMEYNRIKVHLKGLHAQLSSSSLQLVTIENWSKSEEYQHIVIRTIDGISFRLEKQNQQIIKLPVEVDKSAEVSSQYIYTNTKSMHTVEYIVGSNATDEITGNEKPNRIDPGFGGAFMMGLDGHDQYIIREHYTGPLVINNLAEDKLTDTVKLPEYFHDVQIHETGKFDLILSSLTSGTNITIEKYKASEYHRHVVFKAEKDGVLFTLPPSFAFQPTPISIDRTNQAHNLIVDLNSDLIWSNVVTVEGSIEHSNVVRGNAKNNTLSGGLLSDTLEGGGGNDVIRGNEGEDFIDGGDGDDILVGGAGDDWIDGGLGNDVIYPGPGADHVNGGPGFDVIVVFGNAENRSGVFIDLLNGHGYGGETLGDVYVSVEGVIGGFYDDIIVGDNSDNYLDGKESNDLLFPLDGGDILVGGEGNDLYDIGTSTGKKLIKNKARDKALDRINLKLYGKRSIILEKRSLDLVVHVGVYIRNTFCPKNTTGPIFISQWYRGSEYQHIVIELADADLVLDNFTTGDLQVFNGDPKEKKNNGPIEYDLYEYYGPENPELFKNHPDKENAEEYENNYDSMQLGKCFDLEYQQGYDDYYDMSFPLKG